MSAAYSAAVSEMFKLFNDAWTAGTPAIVGSVPEVIWPGVRKSSLPSGDSYWCRVSEQIITEEQTSLSACVQSEGNNNASRYTASGLIFVQLFCPRTQVDSITKGRLLASIAKNAFRGKKTESGIWFRNVRATSLDNDELWNRFNIVAETEYDEVS